MTRQDLALASIRQGELSPSEGWALVSPLIDTLDCKVAERLCDALRIWTWKALDRRRRDDALRGWIDVLNRVEAFLSERFARLSAKIEALTDLLHESLAVGTTLDADTLLGRRHVEPILRLLASCSGKWTDRSVLMDEIGLRPANTTRLMSALVDAGWAEQRVNGREASYRASVQGLERARWLAESPDVDAALAQDEPVQTREQIAETVRTIINRRMFVSAPALNEQPEPRSTAGQEFEEEITYVDWSAELDHSSDFDWSSDREYRYASSITSPEHVRSLARAA